MEHYRIAVGLSSPALQTVSETPRYSVETRQAKSAKQSEHSLMMRKAILGIDDDENVKKARVPSAPLGRYCINFVDTGTKVRYWSKSSHSTTQSQLSDLQPNLEAKVAGFKIFDKIL